MMIGSQGKSGVAMGAGAVVAGLLASVCCLGPAVLGVAGLGALGAAGALEAYRPVLLITTFALLGAGFWFVYRKREVACEDGTCRTKGAGRSVKVWLWAFTLLALAAAFYAPLKSAALRLGASPQDPCCTPAGSPAVEVAPGTVK